MATQSRGRATPHPTILRTRRSFLVLAAIAVVFLFAGVGLWASFPVLRVSLTNLGPDPLRDVKIHVTGASYTLGDLQVLETKTIAVSPKTDSGVAIEFTDAHGKSVRLNEQGYIEPGYRGDIHIDVRDGRVERFRSRTSIY